MNKKILQRLAWKDARTVAPLGIALFAALLVFNVVSHFAYANAVDSSLLQQHWLSVAIWLLVPNLFALGAPAMLIGGEEESGSLAWLRTLPADWRWIAGSKFAIGWIGFLLVFATASAGYLIQRALLADHAVELLRTMGDFVDPLWLHLLGHFLFGTALYFISSICAYAFRSPVSALVAVVPLMGCFSLGFMRLTDRLSAEGFGQDPWLSLVTTYRFPMAIAVLLALGAAMAILLLIARRRLEGPAGSSASVNAIQVSVEAFRPPPQPKMIGLWEGDRLIRPHRYVVLLWQMLRQSGPMVFVAFVVCAAGALADGIVAAMLVLAGLLLIGGMTFYGDSVRQRAKFYHDRGIPPTPIWLSRVVPMFLATVFAIVLVLKLGPEQNDSTVALIALALFAFGITQLTSLWSPRPILVFFAAPVLVALTFTFQSPLLEYLRFRSTGFLWCGIAMTLFASWRMMPLYLSGKKGRGFHLRYLGWMVLVAFLPYLLFFGSGWWRTPSEQTQWRNQTLAMDVTNVSDDQLKIADGAFRRQFGHSVQVLDHVRDHSRGIDDLREAELEATGSVGQFVSFDTLVVHCPFVQRDMPEQGYDKAAKAAGPERKQQIESWIEDDLQTVAILVKWSRLIREDSLTADVSYVELMSTAEEADRISTPILKAYIRAYGVTDRIRSLYDALPSRELIVQSRRRCLIRSWQNVQRSEPIYNPNQRILNGHILNTGGTHHRMPQPWWLWPERLRILRQFDEQVMWTIRRWESGESWGELPYSEEERWEQAKTNPASSFDMLINDQMRRELDAMMNHNTK